MSKSVTGGCRCALVRYQGALLDAVMFRCHCRNCQRLTGAGHSEMVPLATSDVSISDSLKIYEMAGGSGQPTYSGFCPVCGSQIMRRSARMADRLYVHAGSLDEPSQYRPEKSIYAESAQIWDRCAIVPSQ